MNDSRTTDRELQKTIDKKEHQLSETEKTNIKNIDYNPNNDVAMDMDAKIEMHDGADTDDSRNTREDRGERLTPEEMALRRMEMM